MKKITVAILLTIFAVFAALSLSTPGLAVVVDDAKIMPGSACRFTACSFIPTTIFQLQQLLMPPGTHQLSVGGLSGPLTDTCDVMCPIVRDDAQLPPKSAFVYAAFTNIVNGQNRRISCHVENTTSPYFNAQFSLVNASQNAPTVSTPLPADASNIQPITLSTATSPNPGSYTSGTSVIVCTMPVYSRIEEYGWSDNGGDSTDW